MSAWKIIGVAGAALVAAVGGFLAWRYFRTKRSAGKPERATDRREQPEEDARPDLTARHRLLDRDDLAPDMEAEIEQAFPNGWPPDDATLDRLEPGHLIMFAVESVPVGNFDQHRREIITAKVLDVDGASFDVRVIAPVKHAEHLGAHAGHGVRVGDRLDLPRSKVLVAAEKTGPQPKGYDSEGRAAATLKPTSQTKEIHKVKPGTPYDLLLPYRTEDLEWKIADPEGVEFIHIGQRGPLEQVMFGEGTIRGRHTLTVLDRDEKLGPVFVASWSFEVAD